MVKGLRLSVSAQQLKDHLIDRADHHDSRADEKSAALPDLERNMKLLTAKPSPQNFSKSNYAFDPSDPVSELRADIEMHRTRSATFRLFAKHLFNDLYDLDENDMRRLEFIK